MNRFKVLCFVSVSIFMLSQVFFAIEKTLCEDIVAVVKHHTKSFAEEIRSIEFEASAEWHAVFLDKYAVHRDRGRDGTENFREQMRYFQSGNMSAIAASNEYRGLFEYDDSSSNWVMICRGENVQIFRLEEETKEWNEWSDLWTVIIPFRNMGPIVQIYYLWLGNDSEPHVWGEMTSEQNIDRIFQKAKYCGERMFGGAECVVIEFHKTIAGRPDLIREVWFSAEHGYVPVKTVSLKNGSAVIDIEVRRLREMNLDNSARLFIPVEVVSVSTYPESYYSSSVDTVIMDTDTLKINHEIDDTFFEQPDVIAKRILHTGQLEGKDIVLKSNTDAKEHQNRIDFYAVGTLISMVFIGLIVCDLFLRRRRRGRAIACKDEGDA